MNAIIVEPLLSCQAFLLSGTLATQPVIVIDVGPLFSDPSPPSNLLLLPPPPSLSPHPTKAECTDLETDDATKAVKEIWPGDMKQSIWSGRILLRRSMKSEMVEQYAKVVEGDMQGIAAYLDDMGVEAVARLFQLPRSEVTALIGEAYEVR